MALALRVGTTDGRAARTGRQHRWVRSGSTKLTTTPVELDRLTIEEPEHRRGWRGRIDALTL